jgi:hypothetical protein
MTMRIEQVGAKEKAKMKKVVTEVPSKRIFSAI